LSYIYIYICIYIYLSIVFSPFLRSPKSPPSISKVGAVKIPAAEEDPDAEEAKDDPAG
jgi:hypothetical protein